MPKKTLCFEYIIFMLLNWHKNLYPSQDEYQAFSRVKIMKLLFLISVVREKECSEANDLLDIFDDFFAMQNGPVEKDVYSAIVEETLRYYMISIREIKLTQEIKESYFDQLGDVKNRVNRSISLLKNIDNKIVAYSDTSLVKITRRYNSWKTAMDIAQLLDKTSAHMAVESIRKDIKNLNDEIYSYPE